MIPPTILARHRSTLLSVRRSQSQNRSLHQSRNRPLNRRLSQHLNPLLSQLLNPLLNLHRNPNLRPSLSLSLNPLQPRRVVARKAAVEVTQPRMTAAPQRKAAARRNNSVFFMTAPNRPARRGPIHFWTLNSRLLSVAVAKMSDHQKRALSKFV